MAIGWLGWPEEQALRADVNAIVIGYEGKLDMLEAAGFIRRDAEPEQLPEFGPGMLSRR